jgi:PAS domain S-box-containing protein
LAEYQDKLIQIRTLLEKNPRGMTVKAISEAIKVNRNSTAKYLDVMLISGEIEQRTIGKAKLYYRSHRIPSSALLDFSSDYVLIINKELVTIQVNKNFLDLFNLDREDIVDKKLSDTPDFRYKGNNLLSSIKDYLISEKPVEEILVVEILDHVFRVKFIPTVFHDGGSGTSIIMEDITEERKAQLYLLESEERWRSLVELAPDGICTYDLTGTVTSINDAFVRLTGFDREEILGKHFTKMGTARLRDVPRYVKILTSLLRGDIPPPFEFVFLRKDGSKGWGLAHCRLIKVGDKRKEIIAIARDISSEKQVLGTQNGYINE